MDYCEYYEAKTGGSPKYDDPKYVKYRERFDRKEDRDCSWFVNVYRIDRCYGGPEEGGWYYNKGEFLGCYGMYGNHRYRRAERVKEIVEKILSEEFVPSYNMGLGDHDGVDLNGDGDDRYLMRGGAWGNDRISVSIENKAGEDWDNYSPYC